jgi:hypothetical protein
MNCKQILAIANEAISMLPHEETLQMRVRLAQATCPAIKVGKLERPDGKLVINDMADPCGTMHEKKNARSYASYWYAPTPADGLTGWERLVREWLAGTKTNMMWRTANKFDKTATIERLSHCACGGSADDHAKDELENLLKCSHCDTCEAFHRTNEAQQAA